MQDGARDTAERLVRVNVSDLDFAALLVAEGARLVGTAPTVDPQRTDFVLEARGRDLDSLTRRYVAGASRVEPRTYVYARRLLQRALRASVPVTSDKVGNR